MPFSNQSFHFSTRSSVTLGGALLAVVPFPAGIAVEKAASVEVGFPAGNVVVRLLESRQVPHFDAYDLRRVFGAIPPAARRSPLGLYLRVAYADLVAASRPGL